LLADLADANRVADGLTGCGHIIEAPLFGANNDGARSDRLLHRDHVAVRVRRIEARQGGSPDGRRQECKQSLFHSLTLTLTNKLRMSVAVR
jgi:hypothetical protein